MRTIPMVLWATRSNVGLENWWPWAGWQCEREEQLHIPGGEPRSSRKAEHAGQAST